MFSLRIGCIIVFFNNAYRSQIVEGNSFTICLQRFWKEIYNPNHCCPVNKKVFPSADGKINFGYVDLQYFIRQLTEGSP